MRSRGARAGRVEQDVGSAGLDVAGRDLRHQVVVVLVPPGHNTDRIKRYTNTWPHAKSREV